QVVQLLPLRHASAVADVLEDGGLEPAEGEVHLVAWAGRQAARKCDGPGIAALRQTIDVRAARIRQPEELRHLVERLARRVVERMPQRAVATLRAHLVQRSVPSGDDQAQPGRRRGVLLEMNGEQVALEVVDAD